MKMSLEFLVMHGKDLQINPRIKFEDLKTSKEPFFARGTIFRHILL